MHYYCAGAGGVGMSYVERYLVSRGHRVTGVDVVESSVTKQLRDAGIPVHIGHNVAHLTYDVDVVLASPAVLIANTPDIVAARERGIPVHSWQEFLGEITAEHKTISVCGTHGKSTTTAMLGQAMQMLAMDPSVMVGTMVPAFGGENLLLGQSEWLVLESDEFYENFLAYHPHFVLCTSMEPDHLDFFETPDRYFAAYEKFFAKVPADGCVFYHEADVEARAAIERVGVRSLPVTIQSDIQLQIPGAHNRANAALVVALLEHMGITRAAAIAALQHFRGTWRRQERIGTTQDGMVVYDDYAHHPTEIRATLSAMREAYPNAEILALFQPHQFSRTRNFLSAFAEAFQEADRVFIMDIYASRDSEEDKASVSSRDLVEHITSLGKNVLYTGDLSNTEAILHKLAPADNMRILVCMGAGTITNIARGLI